MDKTTIKNYSNSVLLLRIKVIFKFIGYNSNLEIKRWINFNKMWITKVVLLVNDEIFNFNSELLKMSNPEELQKLKGINVITF